MWACGRLAGMLKYMEADSERIAGANGIQKSRCLIILLITGTILRSLASASIERFPRARAPNSIGPLHLATTLPSDSRVAIVSLGLQSASTFSVPCDLCSTALRSNDGE